MKTSISIQENASLAPLTTLKIGGAARYFVRAENELQAVEAYHFAAEHGFPLFVLGGGSNVLIADAGFDGLVLQIALEGISFAPQTSETVSVTAQAGEDWDAFCQICVEKNLQGVECLSGIPGLVGGAPVQNVGAYGQEVAETITGVRAFDRKSGQILELSNADCRFSYRTSIFNTTEKDRFIVLAVRFALNQNGAPKITYKDLREFFGDRQPDLAETRAAVLQIRRAKSMVIDAADENSRSAGSFFKNPIVTEAEFAEILENAKKINIKNVPYFKMDDAHLKIPAAWLIENSGFCKGFRDGNVGLSTNHTLAVVNLGDASAKEVISFKDEIQAKVKKIFDIDLKPEPVFVGFDD